MNSVKLHGYKNTFAAAFAALAFLLLAPASAGAQWATGTNSNDIKSTNTGNVGVGTPTPPSKLTVSVTSNADGVTVDGTANPMFSLKASGVAKGYLGLATTASAYAVSASPGDITLRTQGGNLFLDTNAGVGTPALTILGANGNVGIGTSAPANGLHVHNSILPQAIRVSGQGGGFMNFEDTSATANQKLYQWRSEGGLFRMALANDLNGTLAQQNILVANASGNIGIGTAAPGARLDVVQANGAAVRALSGSASANVNITLGRTAAEGTLGVAAGAGHYATDAVAGDIVLRTEDSTKRLLMANGPGASVLAVSGGKVGVGKSNPAEALDVVGNITTTGTINATGAITGGTINAKYQDVAEWVPSTQELQAGTVVVLDAERSNHVLASTSVYDTKVAGVVSARPGITLGEGGEGKALVATTGRVKVRVDATRSPIKVGDLLVTGDAEGVAMRSEPVEVGGRKMHAPGTIIGKALEPLASGAGEILVLLSLQ
jgi:hypothetical protein